MRDITIRLVAGPGGANKKSPRKYSKKIKSRMREGEERGEAVYSLMSS